MILKTQDKHRFLEAILHLHTDSVIILNQAGVIQYRNDTRQPILGWKPEEVIGRRFLDYVHEQDQALFQNTLDKVLQQQQPASAVYRARTSKGQYKWLESDFIHLLDSEPIEGLVICSRDITEQLAARQELEKLSRIVNNINNGVLILDQQGVVEWCNQSLHEFTGYALAELQGRKAQDLILDSTATGEQALTRIQDNLRQGMAFSEDVVLRNKYGEKRWFSSYATPVSGGSPAENKTYVILTDISQRKQAEEQLQRQAGELVRQNQELQQFTYIVSHNLRAPVANALGFANLLQGLSKDAPVFDEIMDRLNQTVNRLDAVIKDLNTILTIREKSQSGEKQAVLLAEVCRQVQAGLQASLQEAGAQLHLRLDAGAALDANKAFLYSIFYNLINNAIKYRDPGRRLEIGISSRYTPEGEVAVAISDNGLGMDMNRVGKDIFKLYKRFNSSIEGKGMGLFMVKTQLEALGGRITVDSLPSQGTTFTLYFPAYDQQSISDR